MDLAILPNPMFSPRLYISFSIWEKKVCFLDALQNTTWATLYELEYRVIAYF
jgi:hypothetical protein